MKLKDVLNLIYLKRNELIIEVGESYSIIKFMHNDEEMVILRNWDNNQYEIVKSDKIIETGLLKRDMWDMYDEVEELLFLIKNNMREVEV